MTRLDTESLGPLARHDHEPVFDEPWQAQALGLAFSLSERGVFTPAQWSQTLGTAHRKLLDGGAQDTPRTYYEAVVQALEQLIQENGPFSADLLEDRVQTWRQAYLNTPHGQPVQLSAGLSESLEKKQFD